MDQAPIHELQINIYINSVFIFLEANGGRQEGARYALIVLFCVNLLNYADRYVPASVKDLIIADLKITDAESSLPATGMVLVFMFFAVFFGFISDKEYFDRRVILFFGIIFWSAATFLAGLATNLEGLVLLRSLVGIGEAAYGTIVPPMLSDFYPVRDRNMVYGFYYIAIPVGRRSDLIFPPAFDVITYIHETQVVR